GSRTRARKPKPTGWHPSGAREGTGPRGTGNRETIPKPWLFLFWKPSRFRAGAAGGNRWRFHDLRVTVGTNAGTEAGIGLGGEVMLHLLPVIVVVANVFAVTTNRQQAAQQRHPRQRLFQFAHPRRQVVLELHQARPDLQAGDQLFPVEGLGEVIVGPGL